MKTKTVKMSDLSRYETWSAREVIALKEIEEQRGRQLANKEIKQELSRIRAKR